jgi:hypothetical protein
MVAVVLQIASQTLSLHMSAQLSNEAQASAAPDSAQLSSPHLMHGAHSHTDAPCAGSPDEDDDDDEDDDAGTLQSYAQERKVQHRDRRMARALPAPPGFSRGVTAPD